VSHRWSNPFEPFFASQGVAVLDGGLSTALEDAGHDLDHPLWSAKILLERPHAVRKAHEEYLAAGADCIITSSYQVSRDGLLAAGVPPDEAVAVLRRSTDLAMDARESFLEEGGCREGRLPPLVAASIGPYGAALADGSEYRGDYGLSVPRLQEFHRWRWEILAAGPADLLACETIPAVAEAEALLGLLHDTPHRWAWFSFTCRDDGHLGDGTPLSDVLGLFRGVERVAALGVNCVRPEWVPGLLEILTGGSDVPVIVYPNSGEEYVPAGKRWVPRADGVDPVAEGAAWVRRGARIVGGCCRVGVARVRDLRTALLPPAAG